MKKLFLLLIAFPCISQAQIDWSETNAAFKDISWNNYSTSYIGDSDTTPLIVAAIPYNGIYSFGTDGADGTPLNMTFTGSAFRFRSNLRTGQVLYAYDTALVYFLAPGIFPYNAKQFEFRVLQDSLRPQPWQNIIEFEDSAFQLNHFRKGFAVLGGFYAPWDHYRVVQLRRKGQSLPFASTTVYWQQVRPSLSAVFTSNEMNAWLLQLKRPPGIFSADDELKKWNEQHKTQAPSHTAPVPYFSLPAGEKELFFFVHGSIYKKEALEYQLTKNGKISIPWRSNDIDNNYIWLQSLEPGSYRMEIRFRKQRHNVTACDFSIQPFWFQTWIFRMAIIVAALILAAFLFFFLKYRQQRRRTVIEKKKQEKLQLGLHSLYAQLNPHFMFNALSSIQGLVNKNDIAGANRYLSAFGSLLRSSLANSEKTFIPLEQEIRTLETYLSLEQLRFNFAWFIDYDKTLSLAIIDIPPLLLQPFVENAIKHGISALQEAGQIRIVLERQGTNMLIYVVDNGRGFVPTTQRQGYGLKLTQGRIQLLNEMSHDRSIHMSIDSRAGTGTKIQLLFKNWLA